MLLSPDPRPVYDEHMAERFYLPDNLTPGQFTIAGPEAHHMCQVLRLQIGDLITLFNGDGHEYPARIVTIKKSQVELSVLEQRTVQRERSRAVTIACPLPKGDRAAFLVEKLTELGVTRYQPLRTGRSVVHPGEGKMEKLCRYVIEASKQCGRNVLMDVEPLSTWEDLVCQPGLPEARFLADVSGTIPLNSSAALQGNEIIIVLGPEGGWSAEEIALGVQHHWQVVTLGPTILRIETAALAAAVSVLSEPRP